MSFTERARRFAVLHDLAKRGELDAEGLETYHQARDDMEDALLRAQRLALGPGRTPRRSVRIHEALRVHVRFADRIVRTATIEVSRRGFSAALHPPPELRSEVEVLVAIPGELLHARARAVNVCPQDYGTRVGFEFVAVEEIDAERLEMFVFDGVLHLLPREEAQPRP
jgi:hypothetical protein